MAQLTIYLEDKVAKQLRKAAKESQVSQSRLVSELIRNRLSTEWPPSVKNLVGAWQEFPTTERLHESLGSDIPREEL